MVEQFYLYLWMVDSPRAFALTLRKTEYEYVLDLIPTESFASSSSSLINLPFSVSSMDELSILHLCQSNVKH